MSKKLLLLVCTMASVALIAACHSKAPDVSGADFDIGAVGGACFENNTCSGTAVCNLVTKLCEEGETAEPGTLGGVCRTVTDTVTACDDGLYCNAQYCETKEALAAGTEGGACREVTADVTACDEGLVCNEKNTCETKNIDPIIPKIVKVDPTISAAELKKEGEDSIVLLATLKVTLSSPVANQYSIQAVNVDYDSIEGSKCRASAVFSKQTSATIVQGASVVSITVPVCGLMASTTMRISVPAQAAIASYDVDIDIPNHCGSLGGSWCPGRIECHSQVCK